MPRLFTPARYPHLPSPSADLLEITHPHFICFLPSYSYQLCPVHAIILVQDHLTPQCGFEASLTPPAPESGHLLGVGVACLREGRAPVPLRARPGPTRAA